MFYLDIQQLPKRKAPQVGKILTTPSIFDTMIWDFPQLTIGTLQYHIYFIRWLNLKQQSIKPLKGDLYVAYMSILSGKGWVMIVDCGCVVYHQQSNKQTLQTHHWVIWAENCCHGLSLGPCEQAGVIHEISDMIAIVGAIDFILYEVLDWINNYEVLSIVHTQKSQEQLV